MSRMKLMATSAKCPRCMREIPLEPEMGFQSEADLVAHVAALIRTHDCADRLHEEADE